MNIALIGYGKMGKIIEEIAISRGHHIVGKSNSQTPIESLDFNNIDVAIEFTTPHFAAKHIEFCALKNTPIVVGTTSWDSQLPFVKDIVIENDATLLYASNFSIGVNLFFELNRKLAELMAPHHDYKVSVSETHHTDKVDSPSGTAASIANDILLENQNITSWVHNENDKPRTARGQFAVISHRKENVPGTHEVEYTSEIDTIEIKHTAHSRQGFALGAVIAAEWVKDKKGIYTMEDVIKN
ncbi:MAG TPA: 4-hydroxy-tetrahydrodipicolinate reductase [Crocinitomicaceae bacterium]|nr:4-hydroxy-tetrahydrodipicolinate reductase [Crocinitomicaceae bacterium]